MPDDDKEGLMWPLGSSPQPQRTSEREGLGSPAEKEKEQMPESQPANSLQPAISGGKGCQNQPGHLQREGLASAAEQEGTPAASSSATSSGEGCQNQPGPREREGLASEEKEEENFQMPEVQPSNPRAARRTLKWKAGQRRSLGKGDGWSRGGEDIMAAAASTGGSGTEEPPGTAKETGENKEDCSPFRNYSRLCEELEKLKGDDEKATTFLRQVFRDNDVLCNPAHMDRITGDVNNPLAHPTVRRLLVADMKELRKRRNLIQINPNGTWHRAAQAFRNHKRKRTAAGVPEDVAATFKAMLADATGPQWRAALGDILSLLEQNADLLACEDNPLSNAAMKKLVKQAAGDAAVSARMAELRARRNKIKTKRKVAARRAAAPKKSRRSSADTQAGSSAKRTKGRKKRAPSGNPREEEAGKQQEGEAAGTTTRKKLKWQIQIEQWGEEAAGPIQRKLTVQIQKPTWQIQVEEYFAHV